jgi:hypothetical protein
MLIDWVVGGGDIGIGALRENFRHHGRAVPVVQPTLAFGIFMALDD